MRNQRRNKLIAAVMIILTACSSASAVTSSQAAEAVMNGCEWPEMQYITDEYILRENFGLTAEYGDITVLQCPASAVMSEIIVIRSDSPQKAYEALEKRRTRAIERDALYPETRRIAESSVVGMSGDYAYFIMGENAAAGEDILLDTIS